MKHHDECKRYQDALDRLFEGTAPEAELQQLRRHAATCPDCATLLELHRHLHGPALAELESAVPEDLVEGMWPSVETEIVKQEWRERGPWRRSPAWRWVAAVQAAAIVLLAAGTVYLLDELKSLKALEADITSRVASHQHLLAELDWRAATRGGAAGGPAARWERRLRGAGDVTVAEVTRYLRRLPADAAVLDADGARRLLSGLSTAGSREPPGTPLRDLAGIDAEDGLQAGEALALIHALDHKPSDRLPASRLLSLSQWYD